MRSSRDLSGLWLLERALGLAQWALAALTLVVALLVLLALLGLAPTPGADTEARGGVTLSTSMPRTMPGISLPRHDNRAAGFSRSDTRLS